MAFLGSEGMARPFAAGAARGGSRVAAATVAGGTYGSGGAVAESKAPYIPTGNLIATVAGDGQRFPFTTRVMEDKRLRIAGRVQGKPGASALLATLQVEVSFTLQPSGAASAETAATSVTPFSIRKNGVEVARMVFQAGASSATFQLVGDAGFVAGDTFDVVAPSVRDATLVDLSFTLFGVLR